MAKPTLPTNLKDDIMSSSMGGRRRYRMIDNPDGTKSLVDATSYDQLGTKFGAGLINTMNEAINNSTDKSLIIEGLDDVLANVLQGRMAGALALKEEHLTMGQAVDNAINTISSDWLGGNKLEYDSNTKEFYIIASDGTKKKFNDIQKKIIILTDEDSLDPNSSWVSDATDIQYRNATDYYLGIHKEVYVGLKDCNTAHYDSPKGVWTNSVNVNYDHDSGMIHVSYGGNLYLGGGNSCKIFAVFQD